jgi:hypothetical protein
MFASFIEEFKKTPSRVAERRDDISRRARVRAFNARGDSVERLWNARTVALEQVESLLVKSTEVPVIGGLTAAANKVVQNHLDSLTAVSIDGFADMNARDAIKAIKVIEGRVALCSLRRFEMTNKNRKTVLAAIETEIARIPEALLAA